MATPSGVHQPQQPLRPQRPLEQPPPLPTAGDVNDPGYESLFALHRDLVNINSISGHEYAVGIYLERFLQNLNYTVERQNVGPLIQETRPFTAATHDEPKQELPPQRFNLLAHPSNHRRTPVLLTTHIDTVPPFYPYSERPSSPRQIWGRGTVDAKACIATQIFAAQSLLTHSLIPPDSLSHLFVVGEEVGGDGIHAANALNLSWTSVLFGEPTELKLASGHKGVLAFTIRTHGKAAHSGYPWLGRSATSLLVKTLTALENMRMPWSAKYGNSTLNIGTVTGGVAANVVAASASASIGVRIAAGSADAIKALVLETVNAVDEAEDIEVDFHNGAYGPVDIDHDVPGFESMPVNLGTDIPNLQGLHRRYLYGPGSILVAHSDHEHLGKQDMVDAVAGYQRIILHAVGGVMGKSGEDALY